MKSLILSLLLVTIFSCNSHENKTMFIKNEEFITTTGVFYFKSIKIIVKEFEDGSLIFGIADNRSKIIYQQNINESFKNNGWMIFIDSKDNIWFHTTDLQITSVLLKTETSRINYNYQIISNDDVKIPPKMKDKMIDN